MISSSLYMCRIAVCSTRLDTMKFIALVIILSPIVSAHPRRWELIPTKDGGIELYDLTQPPPKVSVDPSDVIFQLYTRTNPSSPQTLTTGGSYVGNFAAEKQTKFVTHGWMSEGDKLSAIRDAWIQAGDYNVIVIDWSEFSKNLDYTKAKGAVAGVGEVVAAFINWLASLGASTNNMQLVGHSLGAHVCGVAGNRVTAGRLNRITGLDPAAPLFGMESIEDRLDAGDANFVQVIHTNGGLLGWKDPMGTIDFFPNGGSSQPGCLLDVGGACSHSRSHEYFSESITSTVGFKANWCGSWKDFKSGMCSINPAVLMGEPVHPSAYGTYYLETGSSSPYALG